MNKSKNSSGNAASIENSNQKINIKRSISFEENPAHKPNSNNSNQEQDSDIKNLNNYADKINLGRNIIYNFSDLEYRNQINKERSDSLFADNLQTNPNSDQGILFYNFPKSSIIIY